MSTPVPKTINLTPTWRAAARIYIACLEDGDSEEAKQSARDGIMEMAEKFDAVIKEHKLCEA